MLRKYETKSRTEAIRILVEANTPEAVDVLVAGLRWGYKENDRRRQVYDKTNSVALKELLACSGLRVKLLNQLIAGKISISESKKKNAVIKKRSDKAYAKLEKAREYLEPHKTLLEAGGAALKKFDSLEVRMRFAELAVQEPPGPARIAVLLAAIVKSPAEAVPSFLTLVKDKDPRIRSLAVRGLREHAAVSDVMPALIALSTDPSWQVRRGAHDALSKAPRAEAVPALRAALESAEGDERRRIQAHLHGHGDGDAPAALPAIAFGLPVTSRRVFIVIDMSESTKPFSGYLRRELEKLLDALPNGAAFQIASVRSYETHFAKRRTRVSGGAKRKALKWFGQREHTDKLGAGSFLRAGAPNYMTWKDARKIFEKAPDTIYLIAGRLRGKNLDASIEKLALWNDGCDAVIYVCSLGTGAVYDLKEISEESGGRCVVVKG